MALTYGFYNSVGGDRKYDAEQMSSVFDGVINDGVFPTVGEKFAVKVSTGLTVTVAPGRAWFDRTWTYLDVAMPLTVGAAHPTLPRIDAVVLEVDKRDDVRANSIKIIAGTADSAPQKPSLSSSGDVYQHALAYITVPAGATTLTQGNIEYVVGLSGCPYVTSVIETTDIDALFAQWDDQFNTWFDNVQAQLEGDVATNLQNQINENAEKIAEIAPKVGDILQTVRSEIDETWGLCNGASYNKADYPLLYDAMKAKRPIGTSVQISEMAAPESETCVDVFGNYIAIYERNTTANGRILVFDSAFETEIKSVTVPIPTTEYLVGITYALGKYVVASQDPSARTCALYVSDSVDGSYTKAKTISSCVIYGLLEYKNTLLVYGYKYAAAYNTAGWYTTGDSSLSSFTFRATTVTGSYVLPIRYMVIGDDTLYYAVLVPNSSGSIYLGKTTSPTSVGNTVALSNYGNGSSATLIAGFYYIAGKLYLATTYMPNSEYYSSTFLMRYDATSIAGAYEAILSFANDERFYIPYKSQDEIYMIPTNKAASKVLKINLEDFTKADANIEIDALQESTIYRNDRQIYFSIPNAVFMYTKDKMLYGNVPNTVPSMVDPNCNSFIKLK